ncbi:hypothetical protein ACTFIW_007357 [Dictyostelium discoideum]
MIIFAIVILSSHIKVNAYYNNNNGNNNNNNGNNNNNFYNILNLNLNNDKLIEQQRQRQQQEQQIKLYSKIKIINTVIESDGVDIVFNNSVSFKNLAYLSVSEYITIPIGLIQIDLYDSKSKKHLEFKRFQIENDTDYTLITTGIFKKQEDQQQQEDNNNNNNNSDNNDNDDDGSSNYSITILSDNFNFPSLKKRTTLRFIHCSADVRVGVDFSLVNAATLFSNVEYIGDRNHMKSKSFGASTNFISIPKSNPYQVFIHETDNEKKQLTLPENLHPIYDSPCTISFLLIGSIDNPKYPLQIYSIIYPLPSIHASQFSEKQHLLSNNYQFNNNNNNNLKQQQQQQQQQNQQQNQQPIQQQQQQKQQQQPNIPSSTSPSSTTFLKFSIAVLSFVLLALLSVV